MASYSETRLFALEGKVERLIRRLEALEAQAAATAQMLQKVWQSQGAPAAAQGVVYALTPSGGIGGRSGSTCPSATCELYFKDSSGNLTDVGRPAPVFNLSPTAVAGSKYVAVGVDSNGDLTTLVESCP